MCLAFALMTVLQACGNNSKGRVGLPAASSCPHARQCMHSQHCKMYSSNPCETRGRARCPTTCFSILEISSLLLKHAHAAVMLMQRGRGMHHADPSAVTGNDKVDFIASSRLVKEAMQRTGPISPCERSAGQPWLSTAASHGDQGCNEVRRAQALAGLSRPSYPTDVCYICIVADREGEITAR